MFKKIPAMKITEIILCLFIAKKFSENENDYRNNKDYEENSKSHSGFKNVSNNFAACK